MRPRGPDLTTRINIHNFTFVHNLLHMTGALDANHFRHWESCNGTYQRHRLIVQKSKRFLRILPDVVTELTRWARATALHERGSSGTFRCVHWSAKLQWLMWASVKTSDVWFIMSQVMRCQNPVKWWEISKAIPIFFYLFLNSDRRQESQEFQTRGSRSIPHDPPSPESWKSEGTSQMLYDVGWSQELTGVLTATHVMPQVFQILR